MNRFEHPLRTYVSDFKSLLNGVEELQQKIKDFLSDEMVAGTMIESSGDEIELAIFGRQFVIWYEFDHDEHHQGFLWINFGLLPPRFKQIKEPVRVITAKLTASNHPVARHRFALSVGNDVRNVAHCDDILETIIARLLREEIESKTG